MWIAGIGTREWGETGLTSETWLLCPVARFATTSLWVTQPGVLFEDLLEPEEPVGGDFLPHVVRWKGRSYLEDGHHRLVRALLAGERSLWCRWHEVVQEKDKGIQ